MVGKVGVEAAEHTMHEEGPFCMSRRLPCPIRADNEVPSAQKKSPNLRNVLNEQASDSAYLVRGVLCKSLKSSKPQLRSLN